MIKVLLERRVKRRNFAKLVAHLNDLRSAALRHPGYVTGETLIRGNDPVDVLVISTWISEDHWKAWMTSEERVELEDMVNALIDGDVKVNIFEVPNVQE
jgi:heme oxygenase (mycobilin-producing)